MKTYSKINPANREEIILLVNRLTDKLDRAVKYWEMWNDGENSQIMRYSAGKQYNDLTNEVEAELRENNIDVQWPGLFPTYIYANRQYHNLIWLFADMAAAEKSSNS